MTVRVKVAPDLLRWAVERAGWDAETIHSRVPKFDEWISGGQRPTLKQLQSFASATHAPFGMLFLPEPPAERLPIPDMRTVRNRVVPRPSADLLDTIYICQQRQDWYRDYALDCGMPEVDFVSSVTTATSSTMVADHIRTLLDFDVESRDGFSSWQDTLRHLIDRVEELGVLVMVNGVVGSNTHRKLSPDEFRGFVLADHLAPLIFVNGADTKAAQIFTLFHEIAHLSLGHSALSGADFPTREGNGEELWCNEVAAEILVPVTSIRAQHLGDLDVTELERLAKFYRISTLAVLKRLFDAELLSWDAYRAAYDAEHQRVAGLLAAKSGNSGGGNYYYTQPLRLSRRFARAVVASAREGSTTYRDAYRLLGTVKHSTFENLAQELG